MQRQIQTHKISPFQPFIITDEQWIRTIQNAKEKLFYEIFVVIQ